MQIKAWFANTRALWHRLVRSREAIAFQRGREARRAGFKPRAIPSEYRPRERFLEATCWMNGWEHEDKHAEWCSRDVPF